MIYPKFKDLKVGDKLDNTKGASILAIIYDMSSLKFDMPFNIVISVILFAMGFFLEILLRQMQKYLNLLKVLLIYA